MTNLETRTFGELLHNHRQVAGLSQEELAERANLSVRAIGDLERGAVSRPRRETLRLLADALDLTDRQRSEFDQTARKKGESTPSWDGHALAPSAQPPDNLPFPISSFVGRLNELEQIRGMLWKAGMRLVTLTGAGGSGKTRLALEVAGTLRYDFADGVFLVNLAPLQDASQVAEQVARTLGVAAVVERPAAEMLREFVRNKHMLLLLDNFEHVLGAAELVSDLLAHAGRLKILVTSREPLHVRGEHEFPVPPLELPDPAAFPPLEALARYSAVALFVERAQAALPSFALAEPNAQDVARICIRLDGLPLAIELIAARIKTLPARAILERLQDPVGASSLQLLVGGDRDLPDRHRSLYEAIAWSYNLLPAPEQTLFVRLAVFVGGCTLPAIAAVGLAPGNGANDALAGVTSLLDKSLLIRVPDPAEVDEPRFLLLETLREYAKVQLEALGPARADGVRQRHARYFLELAEAGETGIVGKEQEVWVQRLAREHSNILAALNWFMAQDAAEQAARLAGAMIDFWMARGHPEALDWLLRVLEQPQRISTAQRFKVARAAAMLATNMGNLPLAQKLSQETLAVAEQIGDKAGVMKAHMRLAAVAVESGAIAQGATSYAIAFQLAQELGDTLYEYGASNGLGDIARYQGDYKQAQVIYEESHRLAHKADNIYAVAVSLGVLGLVALALGELDAAANYLRQALEILQKLEFIGGIAYALVGLGAIALQQGLAHRAVVLIGSGDAQLLKSGLTLDRFILPVYEQALAQARLQLAPSAFQSGWDTGQHLPSDQAIEYALNPDPPSDAPG